MSAIIPGILRATPLGQGQWLALEQLTWRDRHGHERTWESVRRIRGRGAVAIVATLHPSARLVLVRQFRPPAAGFVWEFPAGLVDDGEDFAAAALRELREETGYHGTLDRMLPPSFSSPGLSHETVHLALVTVAETVPGNIAPVPSPEVGEDLEVMLVPLVGLMDLLQEALARGDLLDAKLFHFAAGLALGCRG